MFVDFKIVSSSQLPPSSQSLKEYWLAGNGVFVRAARQGLSACLPITACNIPGLPTLTPNFKLEYPLVPADLVLTILQAAQARKCQEILFYLSFIDDSWQLNIPEQIATEQMVKPLASSLDTAYGTALIEVHSHHSMSAHFSPTDDVEEAGKFRVFAVLGDIFTSPTLNVRLGIYSHFWQIPASSIFEMPAQLTDYIELCS